MCRRNLVSICNVDDVIYWRMHMEKPQNIITPHFLKFNLEFYVVLQMMDN
jgi:hypothetical protein